MKTRGVMRPVGCSGMVSFVGQFKALKPDSECLTKKQWARSRVSTTKTEPFTSEKQPINFPKQNKQSLAVARCA